MMIDVMSKADQIVRDLVFRPRWGWHDDHRERDGTAQYLPAIQQVRSEFQELAFRIADRGLRGNCLQLGVGPCRASHVLWNIMFEEVTSIDMNAWTTETGVIRGDTHDQKVVDQVRHPPYDFLFIDAGHSYDDVAQDFHNYAPMVRRGGLIAFHDALPRARYPEIEVHKFIDHLPVTIFGDEVGTAVMEVT